MKEVVEKKPVAGRAKKAAPLLFFAGVAVYLYTVIKPRLIYHALGRLIENAPFEKGWGFAAESLRRPGGAVEYLAAAASHCYGNGLAGSLTITGLSLGLFAAGVLVLRKSRFHGILGYAAYLPAISAVLMFARYANPTREIMVVLAAVFAFVLYERLSGLRLVLRLLIFVSLFVLLLWAALLAAFVFAVLAGIEHIFDKRTRFAGAIVWSVAAAVYAVTSRYFSLDIVFSSLQVSSKFPADEILRYPICSIYAFYVAAVVLAGLFPAGVTVSRAVRRRSSVRRGRGGLKLTAAFLLPVATAVAVLWPGHDDKRKRLLQISDLCYRREWSEALDVARKDPPGKGNFLEIHDINRALFRTGRLGEEMFAFPQNAAALLMNIEVDEVWSETYHRRMTIMSELGYPSLAEKFAYELLVYNGATPSVLEGLWHIYMLKDNPETAAVFARALGKLPFCNGRGREMLEVVESGSFDEICGYGSAVTFDQVNFKFKAEEFFSRLLEHNPKNRMAFEYMMAYYMLTKQLDKFAAGMSLIDNFDYEVLPAHYREAMITWAVRNGRKLPLEQYGISSVQVSEGRRFFSTFGNRILRADRTTMEQLTRQYAGTYYWYYATTKF